MKLSEDNINQRSSSNFTKCSHGPQQACQTLNTAENCNNKKGILSPAGESPHGILQTPSVIIHLYCQLSDKAWDIDKWRHNLEQLYSCARERMFGLVALMLISPSWLKREDGGDQSGGGKGPSISN